MATELPEPLQHRAKLRRPRPGDQHQRRSISGYPRRGWIVCERGIQFHVAEHFLQSVAAAAGVDGSVGRHSASAGLHHLGGQPPAGGIRTEHSVEMAPGIGQQSRPTINPGSRIDTISLRRTNCAPVPSGAVSRKLHNAAPFDVALPLAGAPGVECRSGGGNGDFQVILCFSDPIIDLSGSSVTTGTGEISDVELNGSQVSSGSRA